MRIPKDRTRLMRVLLAVFVLVMILDVAACLRSVHYWFAPETTGSLTGGGRWGIGLRKAQLVLEYRSTPCKQLAGLCIEEYPYEPTLKPMFNVRRTTFDVYSGSHLLSMRRGIPLLPVAVLCLVLWVFLFWKQRKRRRLLASLSPGPRCRSCDYNLTDNTGGICPECGTAIPDEVKQEINAPPADGPAG